MSDQSAIQWTDTTWNPVTGCTKVSPGCAHCYIERTPPFRIEGRRFVKGQTELLLHPERLDAPLHWRKPRRVFVNSLSDLFHPDIPDAFLNQVFAVMALSRRHTFQVLTKRADRARAYLSSRNGYACGVWFAANKIKPPPPPQHWYHAGRSFGWPLPNVWLGVSVENQHFADERIPLLMQTPAAVRFVSLEPLLGPASIGFWLKRPYQIDNAVHPSLDWVIVGGESGPGARPFRLEWARDILKQCRATGVPCFVKQLGDYPRFDRDESIRFVRKAKGGDPSEWPEDLRVREFPV